MLWGRSKFLERCSVEKRAIAFVEGETVAWVKKVEFRHPMVTKHFGDNRSRRNRSNQTIAFYKATTWPRMIFRQRKSIGQNKIKWGMETLKRAAHRKKTGLANVERIDFGGTRLSHGPGGRAVRDPLVGFFPLSGGEQF
jgi:hypothetical protein